MFRAPALFISHGSPLFALQPGASGSQLRALGAGLQDVRAVLVVSPHWQTPAVAVGSHPQPATVHDFGGFPAELYALKYPAPGAPRQAAVAVSLLQQAGFAVSLDAQRGLDHGAWVPLLHLLPEARIPVFQVSMPHDLDTDGALRLGAALAPLRAQGILVIGSGSLTHNLYEFRREVRDPQYAQAFVDWVRDAVERPDLDALRAYRGRAPHAIRAHPTEEHFLPLLVAIGASHADEKAHWIEGGMTDRILSMDCCAWGLAPTL